MECAHTSALESTACLARGLRTVPADHSRPWKLDCTRRRRRRRRGWCSRGTFQTSCGRGGERRWARTGWQTCGPGSAAGPAPPSWAASSCLNRPCHTEQRRRRRRRTSMTIVIVCNRHRLQPRPHNVAEGSEGRLKQEMIQTWPTLHFWGGVFDRQSRFRGFWQGKKGIIEKPFHFVNDRISLTRHNILFFFVVWKRHKMS